MGSTSFFGNIPDSHRAAIHTGPESRDITRRVPRFRPGFEGFLFFLRRVRSKNVIRAHSESQFRVMKPFFALFGKNENRFVSDGALATEENENTG